MKERLSRIIKHSDILKVLYRFCGSFILNIAGMMLKIEPHRILFNSFGGKKFDDSPRALYEAMIKDPRFDGYEFIWAFHNPPEYSIPRGKIIKTDTLEYFKIALTSKCWITNSGVERGLSFKKRGTLYVNTWHGTPLKKMGSDIEKIRFIQKVRYPHDLQNAQSEYEAGIFSRVFGIKQENMLVCGLPRNDVLAQSDIYSQRQMKEKLGIESNKKVLLYAPTYRDYETDNKQNCIMKPPINFPHWKEVLGDEHIVLLRCHYEVAGMLGVDVDGEFVRDVSDYPVLNDLMIASDVLITDYSSIMFDYSILDKPIVLYTYDYEEYESKRGMYFDVRNELPGGSIDEEELLMILLHLDKREILENVRSFRNKYVTSYGDATQQTIDRIIQRIGRHQ